MLKTVYKWERRKYERETKRSKWREMTGLAETLYITPEWMDNKTGKEERAFWRSIGALVESSTDAHGITHWNNFSPNRLSVTRETFTPITISVSNTGVREKLALEAAEKQRIIPVLETSCGHTVLQFSDGVNSAEYDINTRLWVG